MPAARGGAPAGDGNATAADGLGMPWTPCKPPTPPCQVQALQALQAPRFVTAASARALAAGGRGGSDDHELERAAGGGVGGASRSLPRWWWSPSSTSRRHALPFSVESQDAPGVSLGLTRFDSQEIARSNAGCCRIYAKLVGAHLDCQSLARCVVRA